jgi:uncharacterized membrane protein
MNPAHIHLALNHLPVVGTLLGLLLLLFGLARRSDEVQKAALAVFVLAALLAVPTYFTGESTEEIVEHLPGVSEVLIEQHEDAALVAFVALGALGLAALSALALFRRSDRMASRLVTLSLLLAVATSGLMLRTANLGGRIRHTEIRPAVAMVSPADGAAGPRP